MSSINEMSKIMCIESSTDIDELCININENSQTLKNKLNKILDMIGYPVTVVCEFYYVDKVFRDSYYNYFGAKHLKIERNCKRLSFFNVAVTENMFYNDYSENNELQKSFVGIMVLKPLQIGKVGRTLLNPQKLRINQCYVRTTGFDTVILGHTLHIEAFPFSSQDTETMTCAETTVWNILEYYGSRYSEYKTILPSNIIRRLESISQERNLPSRGLDYGKVSNLLKSFGFSPRLYALKAYADNEQVYKNIFHYYVESGIPLAVGVSGKTDQGKNIGHSVVCIGHEKIKKDINAINTRMIQGVPYIDTSSYYDKYVFMDDNQIPYTVENFKGLTLYNNTEIDVFAVPLYKRIILEAGDAATIIYSIIFNESIGFNTVISQINETIDDKNPIVVRIFLTSSRKYKSVRAKNSKKDKVAYFYSNFVYPKFLWVAEISTHNQFDDGNIYGEIILDATASKINSSDSIIMIRYLSNVGFRFPDEDKNLLFKRLSEKFEDFVYPYPMYINNLSIGGVKFESI